MAQANLIDLDKKQLNLVKKIIHQHIPKKEVWVYGSRVTWKAHDASDLDLAVFACSSRQIYELKSAFEESNLLVSVDVMDWEKIPKNFKSNIKKKYVVLQKKHSLKSWKKARLGDFINIKHGYAFKGGSITNEPTNNILVTPGNFNIGGGFKSSKLKYFNNDIPRDYILKKNDLIVTMTDLSKESDTLGYSSKVPKSENNEIYLHNQRIGLVQFKTEEVDKNFIYWLMRSWTYHLFIVSSSSGTSIRHTSPDRIKEYEFFLPPLPEQKAIAEALSSLDDKIELLHKQNKTLENMAQTLFHKYFIKDAKKDWKEKPLDEIADYLNGLACQKYPPKNEVDKLPVLKIKELRNGFTENSDWSTSEVEDKYIIELGDIIFSWSGSLLLKIWNGQKCILNQHLFKITSKKYPKWFFYFWTKHYMEKFIVIANSKATTMGHIKREDLSTSIALIPSKNELSKMDKLISPIFEKITSNLKSISKLEKLRDTILPKLMNGEMRFKHHD